jgi:MFS family permease
LAVAAVFFANGAVFANWVTRIPAVKDVVGASTGALGVALLGMGAGSLVTMPFAGRLCDRYGSKLVVVASGMALAATLVNLAHAPNVAALTAGLMAYGGAFGVLDVSMNVQAVAVVRRVGRPIMPWFHAAFSFGGLVGAGTGGLAAGLGLSPAWHFALAALVTGGMVLTARRYLVTDRPLPPSLAATSADGKSWDATDGDSIPFIDGGSSGVTAVVGVTHGDPARPVDGPSDGMSSGDGADGGPRRAVGAAWSDGPQSDHVRARRRVVLLLAGLGGIAGSSAIVEGAMADWTALFLRDVRGLDAGIAALGFAAFSVAMIVGRLGGETALRVAGPVRVLRLGGITAAAGLLLAVLVASPVAGVVGFGLVGLGVSSAFPLALTTAGESSDGAGGREIATVSVVGYVGFLVGPPVIGLLAEAVELQGALLVVAVPAVALAALAPVLRLAHPAGPSVDDRGNAPAAPTHAPATEPTSATRTSG